MNIDILKNFGLIYLGSPYTLYPAGLEQAFEDITKISARITERNISNYAPITHLHPIAMRSKIDPKDGKFWMGFLAPFIRVCHTLVVAKMDTWEKSVGLKQEIELFEASSKFVFYLDPKNFNLSLVP